MTSRGGELLTEDVTSRQIGDPWVDLVGMIEGVGGGYDRESG